ncbi:MAG: radical SAM protein [bacterium]
MSNFLYDIGPIRPPSEARSLLIRVNRNCPWNRCEFCNVYKGTKFQKKSPDEIKADIDVAARMYGERRYSVRSAFLQDANALLMKTDELIEILNYLKEKFPAINRITTYTRSDTAARRKVDDLRRLHEAGLTRVHIGLETGYAPLLMYVNKGVTVEQHIEGGGKVKEAGLDLSEYVMPGLGGRTMWREHASATADVLKQIDPDFIRLRSISVRPGTPLYEKMISGKFVPLTEDEKVHEIRLFIENLDGIRSMVVSDHLLNLLQEVEGRLPEHKEKMLNAIDNYLSLAEEDKINFMVGSRLGYYHTLTEMKQEDTYRQVQMIVDSVSDELESGNYPGCSTVEDFIRKRMEEII